MVMQFYRDKEEVDDPWEDDLNAQDVNNDGRLSPAQ